MRSNPALTPWMLLFVAFSLIGCGSSEDPLPPISDIFNLLPGDEITVDGFVTVLPGTFESSTTEVGFAIQDSATAGIAGAVYIQVDPLLGLDFSTLKIGNSVRVRGIVSDLNQMITLTVDEAEDVTLNGGGGFIFFPEEMQTSDIDATASAPEQEAKIVLLKGPLQLDPLGSGSAVVEISDTSDPVNILGWNLWLDDGSGVAQTFWHNTANLDPAPFDFLTAGTELEMVGFLHRNGSSYEVFPRGNFDISLSIPDTRNLLAGSHSLIRGVTGLPGAALGHPNQFGFSLHEENGQGIFVSISSPTFEVKDYEGLPMSTADLGYLGFLHSIGLYPPVRVHVEGDLVETTGGDIVIVPDPGGVRLVSSPLGFPPSVSYATGSIAAADLGRIASTSGILQVPPLGGNVGSNGWTSVVGGYRCRLDDGSGAINVFLPVNVIDPFGTGANFLTDVLTWPIGVNIGQALSVTGFLRHFDGENEIVVLRNQSGYID
ncbi:MAG: hypothetical protein OSB09_04695 [Planctomycetota bacterium]|nr:hypothetical protein [Planctomycetota bacterium]